MDRIEELENLLERYKTFNDTKKNLLSKIINRLLKEMKIKMIIIMP